MRILIASQLFAPSVGGVETVIKLLAEELTYMGHQVRVATTTDGPIKDFQYQVVRLRNSGQLISHAWWADVVIQPNISLKLLWPCLLLRKKIFITHQQWYNGADGKVRLLDRFKKWVARFTKNIAISDAIKQHIGQDAVIIPNPYDNKKFYREEQISRGNSLVCVARLVSDKGVDLLLRAIEILGDNAPDCIVIGDGPERTKLEQLSLELGIPDKVKFKGVIQGDELRRELNRHRIIAIPSRHGEPFGIVALEGIACGCIPIGSVGGGLSEAIGKCGIVVPNEDVNAMAVAIKNILDKGLQLDVYCEAATEHLASHSKSEIAKRYYNEILKEIV